MLSAIPAGLERVMRVDPEILGGEPCFKGTRVPLETVVDNLAAGHSIKDILDNYPSLNEEHIRAVLAWERSLVSTATSHLSKAS